MKVKYDRMRITTALAERREEEFRREERRRRIEQLMVKLRNQRDYLLTQRHTSRMDI